MRPPFEALMVVVVLAGFLGAVIADGTGLARCEQHHIGTQMELAAVGAALEGWRAETGEYPDTLEPLGPRFDAGHVPTDYFGHALTYAQVPGGWRLCSLGRDGAPGGIGEDGDSCRSGPEAGGAPPP